jgi:hypothetical protein
VHSVDSFSDFKQWKSRQEYKWRVGTRSNYKVDTFPTYQNFTCKSHMECQAEVGKLKFILLCFYIDIETYLLM